MKAEYRRDLQNNYLIMEVEERKEQDSYCLYMAEQNEISGLLTFHSARRDGKLYLHYDITAKQALDHVFSRKMMSSEDLLFVLTGICDLLDTLQKYLLNPSQLVFDPQYIFTDSSKNQILMCYLPEVGLENSVSLLAEFFLKRLNHEDRRAVELGYRFYQETLEENFSLKKTLREMLGQERNQRGMAMAEGMQSEEWSLCGEMEGLQSEKRKRRGVVGVQSENRKRCGAVEVQGENKHQRREMNELQNENRKQREATGSIQDEKEYFVTHKERKKKKEKEGLAERIFQAVHPAVLISGLMLLIVLELLFYFGFVNVTEAGGIFFLILSGEILINQYWKRSQEKSYESFESEDFWSSEEERERYEELKMEMYRNDSDQEEEMQETRCLIQPGTEKRVRLVCVSGNDILGKRNYPDIMVGRDSVVVGKTKGESDVILDSPTVSRIHARLEYTGGQFFVKDLNSRNGTFWNGQKLNPQESREISAGDTVAFAEVEYLVYFARNQ